MQTLNVLSDSNTLLREEREQLKEKVCFVYMEGGECDRAIVHGTENVSKNRFLRNYTKK